MKSSKKFAFGAIIFGGVFSIASLCLFLFKTTEINFKAPIATDIFSHYGTLIGGVVGTVFTLAGIFLLIQNLIDQKEGFLKQQIESRFFELVKIQRENSSSVSIRNRSGKKIFITLLREFYECFTVLNVISQKRSLSELEKINLAYLTFFYGAIGPSSEEIIKRRISDKHGNNFVEDLITSFKSRRTNLNPDTFHYKPFNGHQSRLGHYYRHLYQSVKYINLQPSSLLNFELKYQYVKTLRAQLSTHEQALLFFNSLSDLGKPWEHHEKIKGPNDMLITKYNLIKNIPEGFIRGIEIRKYYPDVFYEGDIEITEKRQNYEMNYR